MSSLMLPSPCIGSGLEGSLAGRKSGFFSLCSWSCWFSCASRVCSGVFGVGAAGLEGFELEESHIVRVWYVQSGFWGHCGKRML